MGRGGMRATFALWRGESRHAAYTGPSPGARSTRTHYDRPPSLGGLMAGPTRVSLDELLVRHGAITEEQLQRAKQEQQTIGGDLGRTLVHLGFITEELLMRAWAHQMGIRGVAPDKMALGEDLLQAISVQLCETFGIIAVGRDPRTNALLIATNDPANAEQLSAIEKSVGEKVLPAAATTS